MSTTAVVFKHKLPAPGETKEMWLPDKVEFLHVALYEGGLRDEGPGIYLWEMDYSDTDPDMVPYSFQTVATGEPFVATQDTQHLGTVISPGSFALVLHCFVTPGTAVRS